MTITWHGLGCFRLQADGAILITDPLFSGTGLRGPRLNVNLITLSDQSAAKLDVGSGSPAPRLITGPGEYEAGGILVEGTAVPPFGKTTCYRIIADGLKIIVIGALSTVPKAEDVAALTGGDILLIPVGGGPVLSAAHAASLINILEPRVVIPCYYKIPGLTMKLDPLDKFCKEIGVCPNEELPKYKIARKDLPASEMQVIVLQKA